MDRRQFLRRLSSGLLATAAAHTLDLDKLLWVPGEKTYFLPSPRQMFEVNVDFEKGVDFFATCLDNTIVMRYRFVEELSGELGELNKILSQWDVLYGTSSGPHARLTVDN